MKKMLIVEMIAVGLLVILCACGATPAQPSSNIGQSGLETAGNSPAQSPKTEGVALSTAYEIRKGRTLATPADLPAAYDYGSGGYTD